MATEKIPGYAYGSAEISRSPITVDELERLKETLLFTESDVQALRMAGDVLRDQTSAVLDVWYGFVGSHPHLLRYFAGPDGKPVAEYLSAVRLRFDKWIMDVCQRPYDQEWLDYQEEIAQRHYRTKKNQTDGVQAAPVISMRYLVAFIYPITATIKPFLGAKGHGPEEVARMHDAWFKAVTLHVTLWTRPYVNAADY